MKIRSLVLLFLLYHTTTSGNQDTWTQKAPMPAQPRAASVSFTLNGFGYAGTGLDSSGILLDDFWKYDPVNDSWSQAASFGGSPRKNAVSFVTDSFAYVGTGYDNTGLRNDFYRYDDQNNSWIRIEDMDSAGSVYPRRDASAFAIGNIGYVVGGYNGTAFFSSETWEYDATRDTAWGEITAFPTAGRRWATSFSLGGYGYVGLGYNYSQEYNNDFWKFDSSSNVWTQMTDYPGNKRSNGVCFVINGFAFVGSGFDGANKDDFYRYDPINNQWSPVSDFGGLPISSATGFAVNGKGYLFGGIDSTGYKNELWEYTPVLSSVSENASMNDIMRIAPFPNPAYNSFQFENVLPGTKGFYHLHLFGAGGDLVLEKKLHPLDNIVDVSDLRGGIYYFRLSIPAGKIQTVTGKVILQ